MDDEMQVLTSRGTWESFTHPTRTNIVSSKWIFIVKHKPDESVDRYKARLVACGFTQMYKIDNEETSSPVARMNSIRILLSITVNQSWEQCQFNVKNTFLYGDLAEQMYMEQPLEYIA